MIFVDKSKKEINDKDIFLINTIDGIFVKKINIKDNRYYMKSTNSSYKEIELNIFDIIGTIKGILVRG